MSTNTTRTALTAVRLPGTPPRWVNRALTLALKTPGVRSVVGKDLAIITVTGARTGRRYSTPIQYVYEGGHYLVLSQQHRKWWRNIATNPDVELLVRGAPRTLRARVVEQPESVDLIRRMLMFDHRIARFYHVPVGPDGEPPREPCEQLAEHMVVLVIGEPDQTT
jgi:deazaflavin-dependent oxidoreductase (nitroreductase family)